MSVRNPLPVANWRTVSRSRKGWAELSCIEWRLPFGRLSDTRKTASNTRGPSRSSSRTPTRTIVRERMASSKAYTMYSITAAAVIIHRVVSLRLDNTRSYTCIMYMGETSIRRLMKTVTRVTPMKTPR